MPVYRVSYAGLLIGLTKTEPEKANEHAFALVHQQTVRPEDPLYNHSIDRSKIKIEEWANGRQAV